MTGATILKVLEQYAKELDASLDKIGASERELMIGVTEPEIRAEVNRMHANDRCAAYSIYRQKIESLYK